MPSADGSALPFFHAVVTTVVPEAGQLAPDEWVEVERIVARALAERPPAVRRQLGAFMYLVNGLALARFGTRFHRLDAQRRTRLLESLGGSRLLLVRRGVWGVRTLAFMGYYARPSAASAIGYRALPGGWQARALAQRAASAAGSPRA